MQKRISIVRFKSMGTFKVASGDISSANAKNCAQFFTLGPHAPEHFGFPAEYAPEKCNSRLVGYGLMPRSTILFFIFLVFMSFFLTAEISNKVKSPIPNQDSDKWLLAHIDVETTGLIPGYHEMIDIGVVMTDLSGNIIDSLFLHIQAKHPERLSKGAFKVNQYNYKKWEAMGAVSPKIAVEKIYTFIKKTRRNKKVMMIAHNAHFDAAFIDHLFRAEGKSWEDLFYYYILDIPSMAWGLGVTHNQIMAYYNIKNEPAVHAGISGAMLNVRVYKGILKYRKEMSEK